MATCYDNISRSTTTALSAVKTLRSSVGQIFETLAGGVKSADHADDSKYLLELQEQLNAVTVNLRFVRLFYCKTSVISVSFLYFREVESSINVLQPLQAPLNLGNTSFLSQETTQDRQELYSQLVNSYKWIDRVGF